MAKKSSGCEPILILVVILIVAGIFVVPPFVQWVDENKGAIIFSLIVIAIVVITCFVLRWRWKWIQRKEYDKRVRKQFAEDEDDRRIRAEELRRRQEEDDIRKEQQEKERRERRGELFCTLVDEIKKFKYTPTFQKERTYHVMLYGYLKGRGFDVQYEVATGSSRPDLVIDGGIAIEVKGPAGNEELKELSHKVMKYSNYYKYIVIVMFEPWYTRLNFAETVGSLLKFVDGKIEIEVIEGWAGKFLTNELV